MPTFGPTNCNRDGWLFVFSPTFNYGASTALRISGGFGDVTKANAICGWDISSIPVGATILSATIVLSYAAESLTADQACTAYPLTRAYVEGTGANTASGDGATWNTHDGVNNWTAPGGDYDGSFGSTFNTTNSTSDVTINALTAVAKALASYRFSNQIAILFRQNASTAGGENWEADARTVTAATLTVTYATAPTTQATNVVVSNITEHTADLSCTPGNGTSRAFFVAAVDPGEDMAESLVDGVTYPADFAFGVGVPLEDDGVLWYCVYNGTGSSVTVTNLAVGVAYLVCVVEYNGAAGSEFYIDDAAAGNPASFITEQPPAPVVTPVLDDRRPTLSIIRPGGVEPRATVIIAIDGADAANGDRLPAGGDVDFDAPLATGLPLWPAGQLTLFGGGLFAPPLFDLGGNPLPGGGLFGGGLFSAPLFESIDYFIYRVPRPLRDGDFVIGVRVADALGNVNDSQVNEIPFEIAALPRACSEGRFESYDAGTLMIGVGWEASPDVEP